MTDKAPKKGCCGKKPKDPDAPPPPKMISYFKLFKYSSCSDKLLIAIGVLMSFVSGYDTEDSLGATAAVGAAGPQPGSSQNAGAAGGGMGTKSKGQAGGAVSADQMYASMGFSKSQWDVYRNTVAQIESGGKYDIAGGSGGHYDGRYQLGAAAKTPPANSP